MPRENEQSSSSEVKGWKAFFLKTWHPVPTVFSTIILFSVLGVIFIIFGGILIAINNKIIEKDIRYDESCKSNLNSSCPITIKLDEDMSSPIFVFYELHNFYQNHRRYIKSKSSSQLSGSEISMSAAVYLILFK